MVRIPGEEKLGKPAHRNQDRMTPIDAGALSAPARATAHLGKTIASLGDQFITQGKSNQAQANKAKQYEIMSDLDTFLTKQDKANDEALAKANPDFGGFADGISKRYDGAARQWAKKYYDDPTLDHNFKARIDSRLRERANDYDRWSARTQREGAEKYHVGRVTEDAEGRVAGILGDPDSMPEVKKRISGLIGESAISPRGQLALKKKYEAKAEENYVKGKTAQILEIEKDNPEEAMRKRLELHQEIRKLPSREGLQPKSKDGTDKMSDSGPAPVRGRSTASFNIEKVDRPLRGDVVKPLPAGAKKSGFFIHYTQTKGKDGKAATNILGYINGLNQRGAGARFYALGGKIYEVYGADKYAAHIGKAARAGGWKDWEFESIEVGSLPGQEPSEQDARLAAQFAAAYAREQGWPKDRIVSHGASPGRTDYEGRKVAEMARGFYDTEFKTAKEASEKLSTPGTLYAVTDQKKRTFNEKGFGERVTGKITLNGNTYDFVNGGSKRGSIPLSTYTITRYTDPETRRREGKSLLWESFELTSIQGNAPGTKNSYKRDGLLIHSAKGAKTTAGCIGIEGGPEVWARFKRDLQAEMERNGGKYKLVLGPVDDPVPEAEISRLPEPEDRPQLLGQPQIAREGVQVASRGDVKSDASAERIGLGDYLKQSRDWSKSGGDAPKEDDKPQGDLQVHPETGKPLIKNEDGSYSSERTITIEYDGKWWNIPTVVDGKEISAEEATKRFKNGEIDAVDGTYHESVEDAENAAAMRSQKLGANLEAGSSLPEGTITNNGEDELGVGMSGPGDAAEIWAPERAEFNRKMTTWSVDPDAKLRSLSIKQRKTLLFHLRRDMRAGILKQADDVAGKIRLSGIEDVDENGLTFTDKAARILLPSQMVRVREKLYTAKRYHDAMDGIKTMSNNELITHVERFRPRLNSKNFDADQKIFTALEQQKRKIQEGREKDPVKLYKETPDGIANRKKWEELKKRELAGEQVPPPQLYWQDVFEKRIAAQKKYLGVKKTDDDERIRVLSKAEAIHQYQFPNLSGMNRKEMSDALDVAAHRAKAFYGPKYAGKAFKDGFFFRHGKAPNKNLQRMFAGKMRRYFPKDEKNMRIDFGGDDYMREDSLFDEGFAPTGRKVLERLEMENKWLKSADAEITGILKLPPEKRFKAIDAYKRAFGVDRYNFLVEQAIREKGEWIRQEFVPPEQRAPRTFMDRLFPFPTK